MFENVCFPALSGDMMDEHETDGRMTDGRALKRLRAAVEVIVRYFLPVSAGYVAT